MVRSAPNGPPAACACDGSPPTASAAAASSAGSSSRSSRGREVLVFVGDAHVRDALRGFSSSITPSTSSSGALAPAVTPTIRASPSTARSSSAGPSTRSTSGQPASAATRVSAIVFDELALPITTTASASRRDALERGLTVGGREAEIVARRGPQRRHLLARPFEQAAPLGVRERRLGEHRDLGVGVDVAQRLFEGGFAVDQADRLGRHGNGADRFVVTDVAEEKERHNLFNLAIAPYCSVAL